MKAPALAVLALVSVLGVSSAASAVLRGKSQDRKITEVVKLLQTMLDQSQAEGDTERELFGKYKCYCDTNEAEKKAEVERLTQEISVLESKIEELLAANAKLSKEVAKLDADMKQNVKDRTEAAAIRQKENLDFLAKEADLDEAVMDMTDAIKVLAEVGADQTLNSAAGHTQNMAGFEAEGMRKLKASVKTALVAASSFVSQKQAEGVESFLQAPFTGTYSARSGEVVGILKDMKDTFKANLQAAREAETRAKTAHTKFMGVMKKAYDDMESSFNAKQGDLADNDADVSSKRTQLEAAQNQLGEAEDFLSKLLDMCTAKKKQYEERTELRSQEQAALSEAVAILNSDAAFATFGKVSATSTGALQFVQMKSTVRRHRQPQPVVAAGARQQAAGFLQAAANVKGSSPLLGHILAMLQTNNPFKTVLEEIEKMLTIIEKEGKADLEQKGWCDTERQETNDGVDAATLKISELGASINELDNTINDPASGLIAQIKNTENELQANFDSQVSETKDRKEENVMYQKDIATLVEAEALVTQAVKVLKAYYSKIVDGGLLQVHDDPAPPATWEDKYSGQSQAGTGAIGMLEFILENTKKEEEQAHTDEASSQHDYEDSMQSLKDSEAQMQDSLVGLKLSLAEAEKELQLKREDLTKTEAEKAALEAYLLKIKPGCDFIDTHLTDRITSRAKETFSLESAVSLLKKTPAYKEALAAHHQEELKAAGCQDICNKDEDHVKCKACLSDTSVPGYCAGHPTTHGC